MAKKKQAAEKPEKSPLERSIYLRERAIERAKARKKTIRAAAEEECQQIDKELDVKRVLLDALKRGTLKV